MTEIPAERIAEAEEPAPRPPRRWLRPLLLVILPLVVATAASIFWLSGGRVVATDNAYVKADKVPVSAQVAGTVAQVLVAENDHVTAGQPLFRLDEAPFRVAVARAEARLAQARTDLTAIKASYREKQAELAVARTNLAFAGKDRERQAELVARGFVSAARFDEARQRTELARQQVAAVEQDLARVAATLNGGVDVPIERHPTYLAARAELDQARLDLARTVVRASMAGTVSKTPKPGQYVGAGAIAMVLVANGDPWIEANFPETDLTYVHPGQPVTIRVDTYPGRTWHGEVDSLSPATGAEFSVIPAQNATGNWVKIAQRVPVRIRIASAAGLPALRAGLSTEVRIDTGHRRTLFGYAL